MHTCMVLDGDVGTVDCLCVGVKTEACVNSTLNGVKTAMEYVTYIRTLCLMVRLDMRLAIAPGLTIHWLLRSHDLPCKFSAIAIRLCDSCSSCA